MNEINKKYLNDEKLVQPEKESEKQSEKDLNDKKLVQPEKESENAKQPKSRWKWFKFLLFAAIALQGVSIISLGIASFHMTLLGIGACCVYYGAKHAYSNMPEFVSNIPKFISNIPELISGKGKKPEHDKEQSHDIGQNPKLNVEKAQNEDKDKQGLETKSNWVNKTNKISDLGQSHTNKITSGNSQDELRRTRF